jgi:hypothetical protein
MICIVQLFSVLVVFWPVRRAKLVRIIEAGRKSIRKLDGVVGMRVQRLDFMDYSQGKSIRQAHRI